MSELLKKHQKKEFRFSGKELKLFEPNKEQKEVLMNMIAENSKIENNELQGELGLKVIRYIIGELTNIGDVGHLSDKELETLLDNGNRELQLLVRELEILINEIAEDLVYVTTKQMKFLSDMITALDNKGDMDKLQKKWDRFSKKYKLTITWNDLIENSQKREELESKLKIQ